MNGAARIHDARRHEDPHGGSDAPLAPAIRRQLAVLDEPSAGFDPETLRPELDALGLDLVEDVGAAEYEARYLAPIGRKLEVFEIERVAVAVARGAPAGGSTAR